MSLHRTAALPAVLAVALAIAVALPAISLADTGVDALRCQGSVATIVGSTGPDIIEGTSGDDVIVAGPGNDIIDAQGGDDLVCAGGGRDTVAGGPGDDFLAGGRGRDTLSFAPSRKGVLIGLEEGVSVGEGQDVFRGFRDVLGSSRGDAILGDDRNNRLDGGMGSGDDAIHGGAGDDRIFGNRGDDELRGGKGADIVDDSRRLAQGVEPDTGVDVLVGGPGPDRLNAVDDVEGNDDVHGGRGRDACRADDGDTGAGCE